MKTVRVVRVIEYEGNPDWVEKQLGSSYGEGVKMLPKGSITITTLTSEEIIPKEALKRIRELKYLAQDEGEIPK